MPLLDQDGHPIGDGEAIVNRQHWAADWLQFAYAGSSARYARDLANGRQVMVPSGSTPVVDSVDGWGIQSTAADERWETVLADSTPFLVDVTMVWRGVLLGDCGTSNFGSLAAIQYGNGGSSPYAIFDLSRDHADQNGLAIVTNSGGSYTIGQTSMGLAALYNRPVTIAVSNFAGQTLNNVVVVSDAGDHFVSTIATTGASNNPRTSSAGADQIIIGSNYGAGRFTNSVTTGLLIYSRAFDATELVHLAQSYSEAFTTEYEWDAALEGGAPPPPPPPPPAASIAYRMTRYSGLANHGLIVR